MRLATIQSNKSTKALAARVLVILMAGMALAGCSQQDTILGPDVGDAVAQRYVGTIAGQGPTTVSKDIGPAGGVIVAGPAALHVPAGALDETVTIKVMGIDGPAVSCELLPHGQTFNVDVTLVLKRNTPTHDTILWFDDATTVWQDVGGEVVGGTIQTQLEHFSQYKTSKLN